MAHSHSLKTWPEYFEAILSGAKTFEFRKNDRNFQVGDTLRLREYSPGPDEYTGREVDRLVTYMLSGDDFTPCTIGLRAGYVVMSLGPTVTTLVSAIEDRAEDLDEPEGFGNG